MKRCLLYPAPTPWISNLNLNISPAPLPLPTPAILDKPTHPPLPQPLILPQQTDVFHPATRQYLGAELDIVRLERHLRDTSSPGTSLLTLSLVLALTGPPVRGIVPTTFAIEPEAGFFELGFCVEEDAADVD
ncbi:uncharacterized protein N0V96_009495 [Colletotrichum fioriniae]|uniref:uncharacterized protein n=1 Tax=Colletotrichum fioriniae TaxID=710243 RepID=UPI0032DA4276|nr:hypothetical protein N0V96_009495 [Colletotrichum fioriniae]